MSTCEKCTNYRAEYGAKYARCNIDGKLIAANNPVCRVFRSAKDHGRVGDAREIEREARMRSAAGGRLNVREARRD